MTSFYCILVVTGKIFYFVVSGNFLVLFITFPYCTTLHLKHDFNIEFEHSIPYFFSLFNPHSPYCVLSKDDDLFDTLKYHLTSRYIITSCPFDNRSLIMCENILFLNFSDCKDLEKLPTERYQKPIYFFNRYPVFNLSEFEICLSSSISPEVVMFSLQEFSMFKLTSVFTSPRHFIRSNVDHVLSHRVRRVQQDLGGIEITGAFIFYPPFTIVPKGVDRPDTFDGIEVLLFRQLSQQLNFTLKYLLFDNWGAVGNDGVWRSGVGKALQQGDAQLAVANIWQFSTLYQIMDFGPSLTRAKLGFIIRRPKQIDFNWKSVINTFNLSVWMMVLLSFALTSVVYWFVLNRGPREFKSYQEDWLRCVVAVFGHFTMSTSHNYRGWSDGHHLSRFILTVWSIFSILLTTLLSSGIFSSLTLPLYSPRVDTLRQLVEGGYYWTAQYYARLENENIRQSMFNFQDRWQRLFEKKYKYMERSEVETQTSVDDKITFLVQTYDSDLIILDTEGLHGHGALREFRMVEEVTSETHITFGMEKNSPLLEPLSKMTIRFLEVGLLHHWKAAVIRRWQTHDTRHLLVEHDEPTFREPDILRLKKLKPIFYLLLLGLSFSFLIFCLELVWYFS